MNIFVFIHLQVDENTLSVIGMITQRYHYYSECLDTDHVHTFWEFSVVPDYIQNSEFKTNVEKSDKIQATTMSRNIT